jgi:hypothetical protein
LQKKKKLSKGLIRGYRPGGELGWLNRQGKKLYGLAESLGGFPGKNKAWEGSREEESFTSRSNAWEGPQKERKSSAGGYKVWEGITGESIGNKGLTRASEAWESP